MTWGENETGRGPTGSAIRLGIPVAVLDTQTDPEFAHWRENAEIHGFRSVLALPLRIEGHVIGALSIYAAEPDVFSDIEMSLLSEVAGDISFGIAMLRMKVEHERIAFEHQHHDQILRDTFEEALLAIVATLEKRDPYTAGHQKRVAILAQCIAREMGLPEERVHGLFLAAGVHDLGKIQIPAEILVKPTKLSALEYEIIKSHAQAGYDILKDVKFPWPIADIVLQHHERLDGSGYPNGLEDDQIILEARILAVADVLEAMSSFRPYRPGKGVEDALGEIVSGAGTKYDAEVVKVCMRLHAAGSLHGLDSEAKN